MVANDSTSSVSAFLQSSPDSPLAQLFHQYELLPFMPLITGYCFVVAAWNYELKDKFLLHYWLNCLAGFGGGMLSAWLLMRSSTLPIEFLAMNSIALTWTFAWWGYNYAPGGVVKSFIDWFPIQVFCRAAGAMGGAQLVTARVAQVVDVFPGVHAAPIIIASIAGAGGLYIDQIIRGALGLPLSQPPEILQPSFVTRLAIITSAGHYALSFVWKVLLPEESAAIWITLWTCHQIASDLLGLPLDFTFPIIQLLSKLSNIPLVETKQPDAQKKKMVATAHASKKQDEKVAAGDKSREGKKQKQTGRKST